MIKPILYCLFLIVLTSSFSCSSQNNNDFLSPDLSIVDSSEIIDDRLFLGYYTINIDPSLESAEILPNRKAADHMNATSYLLGWPCANCLKIKNFQFLPGNIVECDIEINHPVPMIVYTVFDLRVIAIFPADLFFYGVGVSTAIKNSDGLTNLWNNTNIPGLLNSYIAYNKDVERRPFAPGDILSEHFVIQLPSGAFSYDIAIDASWAPNDGINFPPNMNSLEVIDLTGYITPGMKDNGGSANLRVSMYDYQGTNTILNATAYSDVLFNSPVSLSFISGDSHNATYGTSISNQKQVPPGNYKVLVQVTDSTNQFLPYDVSSYVVLDALVISSNVSISLANDDNYKTIGNYYDFFSYKGTINRNVLDYLNNNGPWDFTGFDYTDSAQRKILSPDDPELAFFFYDFPDADHFVKNQGNFGFSQELHYQPEKHDYSKNELVPLGFYETYAFGGSYVFTGTVNGFPYPFNTSTSFSRTYKSDPVVNIQYNIVAQGVGACVTLLDDNSTRAALKTRTIIDAKIMTYEMFKTLVYEWHDDDGNLLAVLSSENVPGEPQNWNTSTYEITGISNVLVLHNMFRQ